MTERTQVAREAIRAALTVRRQARTPSDAAVCPVDLAERLGLEVRFCAEPSLEGMYVRGRPGVILLSAVRPAGRQAFSCAHELGHHVFGHGTRVDEYVAESHSPSARSLEESAADVFAATLLMPPTAVRGAFARRGWQLEAASPEQVYVVATALGVGYESLVTHARWSLKMLSPSSMSRLLSTTPKQVRRSICGSSADANLVVVDEHWRGRAVDLVVGDRLVLPTTLTPTSDSIVRNGSCAWGDVWTSHAPGVCALSGLRSQEHFVRTAPRDFVGRSIFRHLEHIE